ncbi:MAG: hypothetical protein OXM55_05310, partial [Bdellovibrionales bacterium]|nr:hypothetical protein [Bdellovibrionales bacterium]
IKQLFKKGASVGKEAPDSADSPVRSFLTSEKGSVSIAGKSALKSSATGVESYEDTLGRLAKFSLGVDNLSPQQMKALENYYSVVRGEKGKDGTFPRAGNYTLGQRRKIIKYLESQGFSREQVRRLIEDGVVEINRLDPSPDTRKVLNKISEGDSVFTTDRLTGIPKKINKILERTDHGLLVEVKTIDPKTGQLLTEEVFVSSEVRINGNADIDFIDKILKQTDRGFVFSVMDGRKVFFSFREAIKNGLLPRNPTAKDISELKYTVYSSLQGYKLDSRFWPRIHKNSITEDHRKIADSLLEGTQYKIINPEFEATFTAVRSTRKKVDSKDLKLPPSTNKEAQLAEQGYKSSYMGGLDQVNEWAYVRRRLQELKANPYTTHIEYFAEQIPDHIAYIKRGLKENYSSDKLTQLRRLEKLEQEAQKAIADEKITYEWWLIFNSRLSYLMEGSSRYRDRMPEDVEAQVTFFPLKIIIPTTKSEDIGIMVFNRAESEGVYPAGLINKPSVHVDGAKHSSSEFFEHDVVHSGFLSNKSYERYSTSHRLFRKRLINRMENLPPNKRKKVEGVYFIMAHENQGIEVFNNADMTLKEIKESIMEGIARDVSGVFKMPDDPAQKQKKLEDLADTFMEVYNQAQQHQ